MEITTEHLIELFREYNKLYFGWELPLPAFGLLTSYRTCGYFSCNKIVGRRRLQKARIDISCRFDWTEADLRDVMVHEMIHYYLAYMHIDNELTHGEAFRRMSADLNTRYGLNVAERVDCSRMKPSSNASRLLFFLAKFI